MIIIAILLIFSFANAYTFEEGLNLLNNGKIDKATDLFCKIDKSSLMYKYAKYYCTVLSSIKGNPEKSIENPQTAVDNYRLFFLAKFYMDKDKKMARKFLKKIDKKALHKEDLPQYAYVKYILSQNKNKALKDLIINYSYDDLYGFPLLKENLKNLSHKELYQAIDKMISYRKFDNALYVLDYLPDTDKKFFYKMSLLLKKREYQRAENIFYLINKNSVYYTYSLYRLATGLKNLKKQKYYFLKLLETQHKKYIEKASYILMKKSFFKGNFDYFKYFSEKITQNSRYFSEKIWLQILYRYKMKDYIGAYLLLQENKKLFPSSKANYWLYLISKKANLKNSEKFLKSAARSKKLDFYSLYSKKLLLKLDIKNVSFSTYRKKTYIDKKIKLIKKLKQLKLYRWAYIEGKYFLKKESNIDSLIKLYNAIPELTARKFALKGLIYESFPKPFKIPKYSKFKDFEDLTFAVIRQESFFDYYAISPSNAMGLMQIIPPTAKWIAKVRKKDLPNLNLLFNPEINIDYGSWYLSYLLNLFNNNIFYAVASYNAGPGAVRRFLKKTKTEDIAEFIEFFPYQETRNYVKKVIRNYLIYKYLLK